MNLPKRDISSLRDPDIVGECGQAWDNYEDNVRKSLLPHATIGSWVVLAPRYHPFWDCYAIGVIHLRQVAGLKSPNIIAGHTHEIFVIALHPQFPLVVDASERLHMLMPPNFVGQYNAQDDEHAREIAEQAVRDICEGRLNPDTDARSQWARRFTDSRA